MRRFDLRQETTLADLRAVFSARLDDANDAVEATVRQIVAAVRERGDDAVLELTRRFDFPGAQTLRVPETAIDAAADRVRATDLWPALERAAGRIRAFHEKHRRTTWLDTDRPGEILGQIVRPLDRVGIYIPGGAAAYPSTVLMTAVPAAVAGVGQIALATPPSRETGLPPDATLAAARIAGVGEIYAIGGAQAIAALAFGTQSVAAVDKVVGPGNIYANLAKRLVFGTVGIDMLAGPSEVAFLIDDQSDFTRAAADLICQTEHTPNNASLVVSCSDAAIAALLAETERQLADLPRAAVVRVSLAEYGFVVVARDRDEAAAVINAFAPEHLHVDVHDPWSLLGHIRHAGAILIGPHSAAALGDYIAGPSHTLPTAGSARFASPLNVDDFVKKSSVLCFDAVAAAALAADAATIGRFEGLEGHARSATGAR